MPGTRDEIVIWNETCKTRERKYYLTMYLCEAYVVFKDMYKGDAEMCSFSSFCDLRPKNVLLLQDTPRDQCKCEIHENLLLKLEAMGHSYDRNMFWEEILCDASPNSAGWLHDCENCKDGRKFITMLSLNAIVTYKQWESIAVTTSRNDGTERSIFKTANYNYPSSCWRSTGCIPKLISKSCFTCQREAYSSQGILR